MQDCTTIPVALAAAFGNGVQTGTYREFLA